MKAYKHFIYSMFSICLFLLSFESNGQTLNGEDTYNPNSNREYLRSDIVFRRSVVRMLDLREKHNLPLFTEGEELSKYILEAAMKGDLKIYANDSLLEDQQLSTRELKAALEIPEDLLFSEENIYLEDTEPDVSTQQTQKQENTQDDWDDDWSDGDDWENSWDEPAQETVETTPKEPEFVGSGEYFEARDLYQLLLYENIIITRKADATADYETYAIALVIPGDHPDNIKAVDQPVAFFSYKEIVEKIFRQNPEAVWVNPYDDEQNQKLEDAFNMRLFSSYIIKVNNPQDDPLMDQYQGTPEMGILMAREKMYELLEFEQELWEH